MATLLAAGKFQDPTTTAKGEPRATVAFKGMHTLWFNTGTLCNITCATCYIESSPSNDRLVYLTPADVDGMLDQLAALQPAPIEIGFTGGEPFLNPDALTLISSALARGHRVLVLTNAMRPMMRPRVQEGLLGLRATAGERLALRVSLDHWDPALHDSERGAGAFEEACAGIDWLVANGFHVAIAGRTRWGDSEADLRAGFAKLFGARGWPIAATSPGELVIFPEMDARLDTPEITPACWGILGVDPDGLMCATSRMVVKRRGEAGLDVVACTLTPYAPDFATGPRLADALDPVRLNHPHCARFCVMGGGSCTA